MLSHKYIQKIREMDAELGEPEHSFSPRWHEDNPTPEAITSLLAMAGQSTNTDEPASKRTMKLIGSNELADTPQFSTRFPDAVPNDILLEIDEKELIDSQRSAIVSRLATLVENDKAMRKISKRLGISVAACRDKYCAVIEEVLGTYPQPKPGDEPVAILKIVQHDDEKGFNQMRVLRPSWKKDEVVQK